MVVQRRADGGERGLPLGVARRGEESRVGGSFSRGHGGVHVRGGEQSGEGQVHLPPHRGRFVLFV